MNQTITRITAVLTRGALGRVQKKLRDCGVRHMHLSAGRAPVLEERKGFSALLNPGGTEMTNDPVDVIRFLVPRTFEEMMIGHVAEAAKLHLPGRGSVYAETVQLVASHELCGLNDNIQRSTYAEPENVYRELMGISCIVQRGQGDAIARVVLESGACVPYVTYGDGTGVRDKLGLLRITIPAEKEVITLVMSQYDADAVMELMIDAGQLDQPGRGFIYVFSVTRGIINNQITRGGKGHAASMEQIISAIDGIKGGMEWRRRGGSDQNSERKFLPGLVDLSLTCNEGRATDLVKAAMDAGASGATISKSKYVSVDQADKHVLPARETSDLIVGEGQAEEIIEAMRSAGAFKEDTQGQIVRHGVPRAFTYLGPKT